MRASLLAALSPLRRLNNRNHPSGTSIGHTRLTSVGADTRNNDQPDLAHRCYGTRYSALKSRLLALGALLYTRPGTGKAGPLLLVAYFGKN